MKKYIFSASVFAMVLFFGACNIYNYVTVSADSATDFSLYETFAWLNDISDTNNSPYNNEVVRNNIKNYFGKSFAERGYMHSIENPDILLQVVIHNDKMIQEVIYPPFPRHYYYSRYYFRSDFYSPYPYNYYYSGQKVYCYPGGYCKEIIEYTEGSITLNVIDRKKNKMVWTCTAKGNIYDPSYINSNIHPAVVAIMKKYPVKPFHQVKRPTKKVTPALEKTVMN